MKQVTVLMSIFLLCSRKAESQNLIFKPSFGVALDTSYGSTMLDQCSRSIPENINGFWTISLSEIAILEDNFKKIDTITAKECCFINAKVDRIERYAFQYIGVIIKGKRFIYINAFPLDEIKSLKERGYDPTKYPLVACDGGDYFWGVLFDIEAKQFSFLAFNGGA